MLRSWEALKGMHEVILVFSQEIKYIASTSLVTFEKVKYLNWKRFNTLIWQYN